MTAQQLKNSILQMAVQGKLVPQDPNDEPASVLLERIRAEKERLIKEKKIKREKNPSVIFKGADNTPYEKIGDEVRSLADEIPFDIPDSWEWVRLKDVAFTNGGFAFKSANFVDEGIRVIRISDFNENGFVNTKIVRHPYNDSLDPFQLNEKNILLCMTGGTVGKSYFVTSLKEQMVTNQRVATIKIFGALEEYVNLVILSPITQKVINDSKNSTNDNISIDTINGFFIPLPPIDEQRRIVDTIALVLLLIDKYEETHSQLSRLQSSFPEALKKSILQEAVQGKLVPQDPSDEPAEALLERIRAEKQLLIKEGKIKKDKHESVIFRRDISHYEKLDGVERCIDDELPFEIPQNWCWVRFGTAITLLSGTDFAPDEYNSVGKGVAYITGASNIVDSQILVNRWTETPRQIAHEGDILLVCKGSGYGKTVICNIEQAHIARQIMAVQKCNLLDMQYVKLFLDSSFDLLKTKGQGVIPGIDRTSVLHLLFPLPPLTEQQRIVQRIEELLPLVKGL